MKYLYAIVAIIFLMACNITSPETPAAPILPTSTLPPSAVNEMLSVSPVVRTADDGTLVLAPQANVTVRWDGLPDGSVATFIVQDFLSDGGVMQIGQGTSASFTVSDRIQGDISATAQLPDGSTINSIILPIMTENMISESCQYIPPALGPGVDLYSQPDMNSTINGSVIYDADYIVVAAEDGVDTKGAARIFYQIQHVETGELAWVASNVGENLAGECAIFQ